MSIYKRIKHFNVLYSLSEYFIIWKGFPIQEKKMYACKDENEFWLKMNNIKMP